MIVHRHVFSCVVHGFGGDSKNLSFTDSLDRDLMVEIVDRMMDTLIAPS
jgi:hypothetical protein